MPTKASASDSHIAPAPLDAIKRAKRALGADYAEIYDEVSRNVAQIAEFTDKTVVILRDEYPELVVVALEGQQLQSKLFALINLAKNNNFSFVRFHTKRKGLIKLLESIAARITGEFVGGEWIFTYRV